MSGVLTRLQQRNEVTAKLGGRDDLNSRVDSWLDFAQIRLAREYEFSELDKLFVADTRNAQLDYGWPDRTKCVFDLRLMDGANSWKLIPRHPRFQDLVNADPTTVNTTTRPRFYTPWGRCFELDPVPDAAYVLRLRCSLWPTLFTGDGAVSDFEYKDEIIIEMATAIGYVSLMENEDALVHIGIAKEMIEGAKEKDLKIKDYVAKGRNFEAEFETAPTGQYWADPFHGLW